MIRRFARPAMALCLAAALTGLATPAYAGPSTTALASVSCTGGIQTSVSTTSVTVSGSATCAGLTTLSLTTTLDASGAVSSVTSLLPALPGVALPIGTSIPALGVTSACSVLVDTSNGATVGSSCSAG
jgi:hypothetical protein